MRSGRAGGEAGDGLLADEPVDRGSDETESYQGPPDQVVIAFDVALTAGPQQPMKLPY